MNGKTTHQIYCSIQDTLKKLSYEHGFTSSLDGNKLILQKNEEGIGKSVRVSKEGMDLIKSIGKITENKLENNSRYILFSTRFITVRVN